MGAGWGSSRETNTRRAASALSHGRGEGTGGKHAPKGAASFSRLLGQVEDTCVSLEPSLPGS